MKSDIKLFGGCGKQIRGISCKHRGYCTYVLATGITNSTYQSRQPQGLLWTDVHTNLGAVAHVPPTQTRFNKYSTRSSYALDVQMHCSLTATKTNRRSRGANTLPPPSITSCVFYPTNQKRSIAPHPSPRFTS